MRAPAIGIRWQGTAITMAAAGAAVLLGGVAATLGSSHLTLAVIACALPLLPLALFCTQVAVVAMLACLPFQVNLLGGSLGGVKASPTDLLLAASLVGVLLLLSASREAREKAAALRPIAPLLLVYFAAALLAWAWNPSWLGAIAFVQRIELVVVPLLLGAVVMTARGARLAMALFVGAAVILGIAFLLPHASSAGVLGAQKNPGGQFIVDAALVTLAVFTARRYRFTIVPLLVAATYATQSRGALIGLAVGFVLFCMLRSKDPVQATVRALPLAALLLTCYLALPVVEQDRVLGNTASTAYNDALRADYADAAWQIFQQNPVAGIGIGNYLSSNSDGTALTNDPHNVLLLEAAEGGGLLVIAFLILQLGALVIIFRRRKQSPWAIAAICVQVSILVHALVDVYWVRGTPVIGWLLIGLALAPLGKSPGGGGDIVTTSAAPQLPARTADNRTPAPVRVDP